MYPTLSDALHDLLGINIPLPIQTFGLILALSFFLAAYILILEFKRKERNGLLKSFTVTTIKGKPASTSELFWSGAVGFLVGFKLLDAILNTVTLLMIHKDFYYHQEAMSLEGYYSVHIRCGANTRKKKNKN